MCLKVKQSPFTESRIGFSTCKLFQCAGVVPSIDAPYSGKLGAKPKQAADDKTQFPTEGRPTPESAFGRSVSGCPGPNQTSGHRAPLGAESGSPGTRMCTQEGWSAPEPLHSSKALKTWPKYLITVVVLDFISRVLF